LKQTSTLSARNAAHVSHETDTQAHSRAFPKKQYANSISLAKMGPGTHPDIPTKETQIDDTDTTS